jgi:hypothetical protein
MRRSTPLSRCTVKSNGCASVCQISQVHVLKESFWHIRIESRHAVPQSDPHWCKRVQPCTKTVLYDPDARLREQRAIKKGALQGAPGSFGERELTYAL